MVGWSKLKLNCSAKPKCQHNFLFHSSYIHSSIPKTCIKKWLCFWLLPSAVGSSTMATPCINYMQYPWGYAVPVRICITRESYPQYPRVISSVPVRICSARESYPQYPWVISSVPVRICSTSESYPQYLWGYAVPVSHIISTHESYPQYFNN